MLCKGTTLYSRLIRWWTKSEFSHAALVFSIPSRDDGFERTFLIEAGLSGVDITDLEHYVVDRARSYDVAIKRCEADWMSIPVQRAIRGTMLNHIKANYDYGKVVSMFRTLLANAVFGLTAGVEGIENATRRSRRISKTQPSRFLCSGFVQYGFFSAIDHLIKVGRLKPAAMDDVLFKPGLSATSKEDTILATTPEDMAQSSKLTWRFAIRRGQVYGVTSYASVRARFADQNPSGQNPSETS